jgi:hypothetical protein
MWGALYRRERDGDSFEGEPIDEITLMPADLADESCDCEVIALQTQDTSDVLIYDHWRDGVLLRGLSYSMDRGFDRAEGKPDAWEAKLFGTGVVQGSVPYTTLETMLAAIGSTFGLPDVG